MSEKRKRGVFGWPGLALFFVVDCVVMMCSGLLGGCSLMGLEHVQREGMVYPMGSERVGTLDVQVVRYETVIEFTNTTAGSVGPGRLWLNREYSLEIGEIGIGETERLELVTFVNEHGEAYRAGGFFATERPTPLVQAEVEDEGGEIWGLVVVGGEG